MSMSPKLRHVVATLAVFVVTPASADTIQLITSIDALGPLTDVVDWSRLGKAFTTLEGPQTVKLPPHESITVTPVSGIAPTTR